MIMKKNSGWQRDSTDLSPFFLFIIFREFQHQLRTQLESGQKGNPLMLGAEGTDHRKHLAIFMEGQVAQAFVQCVVALSGCINTHVVAFCVVPVQRVRRRMAAVFIEVDWFCSNVLPQLFEIFPSFTSPFVKGVSAVDADAEGVKAADVPEIWNPFLVVLTR